MNYVVTFEYPYKPADDEETAIAFKVFDSFNAKKPDLPQVKIHAYFGDWTGMEDSLLSKLTNHPLFSE